MNISKSLIACAIAAGLVSGAYAVASSKVPTRNVASQGIGAPMAWPERKALITTVVQKWSAYVKQVRGVDPVVWARSMGPAFATADAANFRRAATMTTYEGMVANLLGQRTTDDEIITKLAKDSSAATLASLASPSSNLVYTVITPCRIIDTRVAGGKLQANTVRSFHASRPGGNFTDQGGSDTDCGIPANPAAVVMNVVTVHPDAQGYITLFPYGVTQPLSATVNNVVGTDVGNETIVKLTVGDYADFSAYSFAGTNMVADAVGYFAAGDAGSTTPTPLSTSIANGVNVQVDNGMTFTAVANCPTGYSVTGGGDVVSPSTPGMSVSESYPSDSGTSWTVTGKNNSGGSVVVHARAVCAKQY
jgi:hypothetical protein